MLRNHVLPRAVCMSDPLLNAATAAMLCYQQTPNTASPGLFQSADLNYISVLYSAHLHPTHYLPHQRLWGAQITAWFISSLWVNQRWSEGLLQLHCLGRSLCSSWEDTDSITNNIKFCVDNTAPS